MEKAKKDLDSEKEEAESTWSKVTSFFSQNKQKEQEKRLKLAEKV